MTIDRYLQQVRASVESTKIHIDTQQEMPHVLSTLKILTHGFNYETYQKLLPLTLIASKNEQHDQDEITQLLFARLHAAKLAIIFTDYERAVAYLQRFAARCCKNRQPLHDACLFTLPDSNEWSIPLWHALIARYSPSTPEDLIMRLLPFAAAIEKYTRQNPQQVKNHIKNQVVTEFRQRFVNELAETLKYAERDREAWINEKLACKQKAIRHKVQINFEVYLKKQTGLPVSSNLDAGQIRTLSERTDNLTAADKAERNRLESEIMASCRIRLAQKYQPAASPADTMEEFLRKKIEAAQSTINAIVSHRSANLLTGNTRLETLLHFARNNCYQRAQENPAAAELFFEHTMNEKAFNQYLALVPKDDANIIPDVFIGGESISSMYKDYYVKKLHPADPRAAILGKYTSCCQYLGNSGEEATIHGITSDMGGFYILCKMKTDKPSEKDDIVSQCWAWRGVKNELVFDSVEIQLDYRSNKIMIADFYTYLAHHLVSAHSIPRILAGIGGATPGIIGALKHFTPAYVKDYREYRDSHRQRLIADRELPLLSAYLNANKESALKLESFPNLGPKTLKKVHEWVELCLANERIDLIACLDLFLSSLQITTDYIKNRKELVTTYIHALLHNSLNMNILRDYIEKGGDVNLMPLYNQDVGLNMFQRLGKAAIHFASFQGDMDMLSLLVENSADTRLIDMHGTTSIFYAAKKHHWQVVKILLEHDAIIGGIILCTMHEAAIAGEIGVLKMLLERKVKADVLNPVLDTPLHCAVEHGHAEAAKLLLEYGADVNHANGQKKIPLHLAAKGRHPRVIRLLLAHGAKADAADNYGNNSLHYIFPSYFSFNAPLQDDSVSLELTTTLHAAGANLNIPNYYGEIPLMLAVAHAQIQTAKYLVKHGADIRFKDKKENTLLHYAVMTDCIEMIQWLVEEHLLSLTAQNKDGDTVLHMATRHKSPNLESIIGYLISHGADLNAQNSQNQTPVAKAAHSSYDNWDTVAIFLSFGCDISAKNKYGEYILHSAISNKRTAIVKQLIELEADVNEVNLYDKTPLEYAVECNAAEILEHLLLNGADVHRKNREGKTVLDQLIGKCIGQIDDETKRIWCLLIEKGAGDVAQRNQDGKTMLHLAAGQNCTDVIKALLKRGADINAYDNYGWTPLIYIIGKGNSLETVQYLVECGADVNLCIESSWGESTPLEYALHRSTDPLIAPYLIEHGANIHVQSTMGGSLLLYAATYGNLKSGHVQLLAEKGLDVNEQDCPWRNSALHRAADDKAWEVVTFLLIHGADAALKNSDGKTPLDIAQQFDSTPREIIELLEDSIKVKEKKVSTSSIFKSQKDHEKKLNTGVTRSEANAIPMLYK